MTTLHITNHIGTTRNIKNVFALLNKNSELISEKWPYSYYVSKKEADVIFNSYQSKLASYSTLLFSDTSMYARPFLQNMDKHNLKIIIYITNRFDWGIHDYSDDEYFDLYKTISSHPRVSFCADNRYDQYYARLSGIRFYYEDIIRLTPLTPDQSHEFPLASNGKIFIYNRGSQIENYHSYLTKIKYDIFGERHYRYRDEMHIREYVGYLHLPYQTNIQSLWENLAYGIIYFIPSKKFITQLIFETDWYYWEEKSKPLDVLLKSIELAEWYQPEHHQLFEYFDSWDDLRLKINTVNVAEKRKIIYNYLLKNNDLTIDKWRQIL